MINAKTVITCGAVFAAANGMAYAAWQVGDFTETRPIIKREFKMALEQLEQNTQGVLWLRFQILDDKYKRGGLTLDEAKERCQIAKLLEYPMVPGCG